MSLAIYHGIKRIFLQNSSTVYSPNPSERWWVLLSCPMISLSVLKTVCVICLLVSGRADGATPSVAFVVGIPIIGSAEDSCWWPAVALGDVMKLRTTNRSLCTTMKSKSVRQMDSVTNGDYVCAFHYKTSRYMDKTDIAIRVLWLKARARVCYSALRYGFGYLFENWLNALLICLLLVLLCIPQINRHAEICVQ